MVAAVADGDLHRRAATGVRAVVGHRVAAFVSVHVTAEQQIHAVLQPERLINLSETCGRQQVSLAMMALLVIWSLALRFKKVARIGKWHGDYNAQSASL